MAGEPQARQRRAWTLEEERAVLDRLLEIGPWGESFRESWIRSGGGPWIRRPRARMSRKRRCKILALVAAVLWTGVVFQMATGCTVP